MADIVSIIYNQETKIVSIEIIGSNNGNVDLSGYAQLDSNNKVTAVNSRPSQVSYNAANAVMTFTWADGSTQNVDLPIENLFQNASYDSGTRDLTITTNGGGTINIPLDDLMDLPEIVLSNSSNPSTTPSNVQKIYLRQDTGAMWSNVAGAWVVLPTVDLTPYALKENTGLQSMLDAADILNNFQEFLSYTPTFTGFTQSWLARNARVGRTITSNKCKTGDAVLAIDLANPSNGEGGDQLVYTTSLPQPNVNKSTPSGINGDNVVYYEQDGGFVRILNVLNAQLGMKTPINPTKPAPFEYMHVVRINKGIVPYESIISGTFGLKYEGGNNWKIYSSLSGNDNFQDLTWNVQPFLDKIIILHFNFLTSTTMQFRISHPSVGNYYQENANWNTTFTVNKALNNIVIGTNSHPIIADHFAGVLKSNGSFTANERNANIAEMLKLFPIDKTNPRPYFAPTLSYASNIFTLNLNTKENAFPAIPITDLKIRWWKYVKNGPNNNGIDDRVLMQEYAYGQFVFADNGATGNPLTYNRLTAALPTDGANKADIVCDVVYKFGVNYPFVTIPFGSYS